MSPDVVLYLENPPSASSLKAIVKKLGAASVREMMRVNEALYKELSLKEASSEDVLINAMAENPILIERPIVVNGDKAAIGRPPENVLDIL